MASSSSYRQSTLKSRIIKLFNENDPYPFLHLINNLFSEDEAVSGPADSLYNAAKKELPGALSQKLAKVQERSPKPITRIRCSTLLSCFLANNWPGINPIFQNEIKASFIKLLQNENNWEALKIHCTCVSSLGALLFPKNDWPEMLSFMLECLSSSHSAFSKWASVILLKDLIPKCPEVFSPSVSVLNEAFQRLMDQCIEDDIRVRTTTVGAAVKLILYLAIPSNHDRYCNLLTGMISALTDALFEDQEDLACNVLDEMVVLARAHPGFLRVQIKSLAEAMIEIASDTKLKEQTRKLAVQFLVTVAEDGENGCGIIQNLPSNLIEELLTLLLQMLMCVKDDISWDEANADDMDAGKTSISCYAEEAWSRLAIALRGDVTVPKSPDMLPDFLEDDDWKKRYAAVTGLGLIVSGCSKTLVQYLKGSVERIMKLVPDQHPRVRWAAIHAIGEFSKYLSPYLQEQFHQQVVPALSEAMDDFGNPRVQTHAASALVIFSQNCCSNILKPYLKEIMSKLLTFLQKGKTILKEAALKTFASLADSAKDDFQPFYGIVMPYLKLVLVTAKENSNHILMAKSLECVTAVAVAVGKSVFCADVEEVVKVLISLQESNCNMDDQVRSYLLQAWGRLCIALGVDFLPYLSASMPQLIQSAQRGDYLTDDDWIKATAGNCKNELRSTILKEKFLACNMLGCFAAHMKGGLHLWIKEVVDTVLPLVNFKFDEQVRIAAISAMPLLLQSAAIAIENKLPIPDFCDSPINTLSNTIISALFEALQASSIQIQVQILVALNQSIQIPNTWIHNDMAIPFVESILKVLSACFHRKTERENRVKTGTDLRKQELLKEEIQDDENVCREIRICLQILIKRLNAQGLILGIPFVRHMWENDKPSEERRMALSIFRDIAEQCRGHKALGRYEECIPFLLKACKDTNPDVQQIAACAIGIYAEFGGEVFKQHLQDGLSSLEAIFQHPGGFDLEHMMAKEAAVSAYGRVCFFLCEEISSCEVAFSALESQVNLIPRTLHESMEPSLCSNCIALWLFHLPLRCNFDEAKAAHSLLCSMIEKLETKVTGPDDVNIPTIITIMAEVLWVGKNLATEETQSKMIQQLKMFRQKLEDEFIAKCKSLPPYLQNTLRSYLSL